MSFLKQFKIRTKVFSVCFILLILIVLIGFNSLRSMKNIQHKVDEIFNVRLPSIDLIIEADRDLQQLLVAERSLIFAEKGSADYQNLLQDYKDNLLQSEERFEKFRALSQTPETLSVISTHDTARSQWEQSSQNVLALIAQNTEESRRAAAEMSLRVTSEAFERMRDQMDKLTEINLTAAENDDKEAVRIYNTARTLLLLSVGLAFVVGLILTFVITSAIVTPVKAAIENLKDIAQGDGDLTKRLDESGADEIGEMGKWFNAFVIKLQDIVKQIAESSEKVNSSSTSLSHISRDLLQGAEKTSGMANQVSSSAEEMSDNLNNVAAAMEQSAANANMVASAAEEMHATINEIAQSAEKAKHISLDAVTQAKEASEYMAELGTAADKIGKVTETITEISEQTNLLALNATIESARAGEAGKGFAVVANEIKELAKQTAVATQDIKMLIDNVQETTNSTGQGIRRITEVITGVNDTVGSIAAAVEEQTATTSEIAENIATTSAGIQDVNDNVNQSSTVAAAITEDIAEVSTASGQIAKNSGEVENRSVDLQTSASQLKLIVNSFRV